MDTLGFEPRAFRMRTTCDITTPCAPAWGIFRPCNYGAARVPSASVADLIRGVRLLHESGGRPWEGIDIGTDIGTHLACMCHDTDAVRFAIRPSCSYSCLAWDMSPSHPAQARAPLQTATPVTADNKHNAPPHSVKQL